jgi:sugar phosphate isomerase/epimerase
VELGCSTILYGGHSLDEALAGIRKAGYKAIELCAIVGMADHIPVGQPASFYEDMRKKIADHGLAIESIGGTGDVHGEAGRARFIELLKIGKMIGAPAITTASGGKSDDDESFRQIVESINGLAKEAAATGVKISIKPHVGSAVYSTKTAIKFREHVDRDWIGINVDASHLWRTPEQEMPEESIAALAPHIFTARIRDTLSRERPIGPVETQIPGGGAMNMAAIMAEIQRLPLKYMVLEIVGTKDWALVDVQRVVEESKAKLDPFMMGE